MMMIFIFISVHSTVNLRANGKYGHVEIYLLAVWPDRAIFCTLSNHSKSVPTIKCQNLPHSYAIFVKVSKSLIFLVKSFLGNFYKHLAIFIWSHCLLVSILDKQ